MPDHSPPTVAEGDLLWTPSEDRAAGSRLRRYVDWLKTERGLELEDWDALWRWSVDDLDGFWRSVADYFEVRLHAPAPAAIGGRDMPGARWFEGATLNHAEHLLRRRDDHVALLARSEDGAERSVTYAELARLTARVADGLRALGVGRGDRVAAFLPNVPEAVAAFLGAASLGAVWSSCAPEFGAESVLDRLRQVEPKILFAVDGYRFGGRWFDRSEVLATIRRGLPSLAATILLRDDPESAAPDGCLAWDEFQGSAEVPTFEAVPFDHPLWILYSSGTTGLPKAIVHGHGGILLEHYKALALHGDVGPDDRFFWFTTTGWMMWNFLVGGLLVGATVVLWDGSPVWPRPDALWELAADAGVTWFGASAPYLMACRKGGQRPGAEHDLSRLRAVGSTGAPLPAEGFAWVYDAVGRDLNLASISGGTDVCTAFLLGNPTLPVHAGELQCRGLGCRVEAFSPSGEALVGEVGELVLTEPMPSMPVAFWKDPGGRRMRDSYFDTFAGVWRHGDWVRLTERGSCVVYGRSDSTLNRGGVRMGTSELYRVVEALPEVADSLVVDTGTLDDPGRLWLFVVPAEGADLDDELRRRISAALKAALSPRHVPDRMERVPEVPYTLSGKKIEVPIKRILAGAQPERAVSADTLRNPRALDAFLALASTPKAQ